MSDHELVPLDQPMFTGAVHPFAAAFPMLPAADLDALADSIRRHGQLHPILLTPDGVLVDGRNRLSACERAGVEPRFAETTADPLDVILAANVDRRHMTAPQRMAARAKVAHARGLRVVGSNGQPRWKRGASDNTESVLSTADRDAFRLCGKVVDHDPALLDRIIAGHSLEAILADIADMAEAEAERAAAEAEAQRRWRVLVDRGYAERISEGHLTEDEAWALISRLEAEERQAAEQRADGIRKGNVAVSEAVFRLALMADPENAHTWLGTYDPADAIHPVTRAGIADAIAALATLTEGFKDE